MRSALILFFSLFGNLVFAQSLSVSSLVKFSSIHELATDSETVFIRNFSNEARTIDEVRFPVVYETAIFSSTPLIGEVILPNDSVEVKFYFNPDQNILYTQDLLVGFDNGESIVVEMEGQGRFTNTYYQPTQNKHEQDLKDALKARLAQGYSGLSYNAARDNMYAQLDNNGGDVECVYTARKATFNTRAGANANNFNCEHTFPQSFFSSNEPMKSDIHHLFPTDGSSNSVRSNNPFGIVANPTWTNGGSKYGSSVFEPRDAHKGDCARAMMYFVTRYQDYQGFFAGQEALLRQWHKNFPPTQSSIDRNNGIANLQTSRNPFVDYPQLIKRITTLSGNSVAAVNYNVVFNSNAIEINAVNPTTDKALVTKGIANTGNTAFTVYSPGFFEGNHKVLNFPANDSLTLEPGESFTFLLEIDPTSQVNVETSFSFGTTDSPMGVEGCTIRWDPILSIPKSQTKNQEVNIFPNPSNGYFFIASTQTIEQVKLFDLLGNQIEVNISIVNQRARIMANISSGAYLVEVKAGNNKHRSRIIIH